MQLRQLKPNDEFLFQCGCRYAIVRIAGAHRWAKVRCVQACAACVNKRTKKTRPPATEVHLIDPLADALQERFG